MTFRISTFTVGLVTLLVGCGGMLVVTGYLSPSRLMSLAAPAGIVLLVIVGAFYLSRLVWRRR